MTRLIWSRPSSSLRFVAYLERRLEAVPVLVVAAARIGELDTEPGLVSEILRRCRSVALEGLGRRDEALALIEEELSRARKWVPVAGRADLLGAQRRRTSLRHGVPPVPVRHRVGILRRAACRVR